ncbi:MAG: YlxR family protein [Clostridia bacterium]|nr:YlxR family protein [Clostridia bacterium]
MEKKVPMRTCIACRACKPKKELIRIVKSEEGISLDRTGRKNGRGAYICDDANCIAKLKKGKLLNRAFSCPVEDSVYDKISEEFFGKQE